MQPSSPPFVRTSTTVFGQEMRQIRMVFCPYADTAMSQVESLFISLQLSVTLLRRLGVASIGEAALSPEQEAACHRKPECCEHHSNCVGQGHWRVMVRKLLGNRLKSIIFDLLMM